MICPISSLTDLEDPMRMADRQTGRGSWAPHRLRAFGLLSGLLVLGAAHAQEQYQWDSYEKRVDSARTVQALGSDAFGDSVSLQNGALSFTVTDVDLPGNNALPVRFTRTYSVTNTRGQTNNQMLADWSVQVPQISGRFATDWLTSGPIPTNRCSDITPETASPPIPFPASQYFELSDFWQGVQLDLAGAGGGELLKTADGVTRPNSTDVSRPYLWTTDGKVHLRCIASIAPGTGGNASGEGFEAITPDGTKYEFRWMGTRAVPGQRRELYDQGGGHSGFVPLPIFEITLYATRVVDRFGNSVSYSYSNTAGQPGRLMGISSSDGRQISITYLNDRIRKVTAGTREWVYDYGITSSPEGQPTLSAVTLPDTRQWTINFSDLSFSNIEYDISDGSLEDISCYSILGPQYPDYVRIGSITHPSGATASFRVGLQEHGLSQVSLSCQNYAIPDVVTADNSNLFPWAYWSWSLQHKEISGPGISPNLTWDYSYDYENGISLHPFSTAPLCTGAQCYQPWCTDDGCAGYSLTWVTLPDGSKESYKFGTSWQYNEGKLLRIDRYNSTNVLLQTESHRYDLDRSQAHAAYPTRYGTSFRINVDGFNSEYHRPELATVTTRDGVDFSWAIDACDPYACMDHFARPLQVTQSSTIVHGVTPGYTRLENYSFEDDPDLWVLQRKSVSMDGDEVARAEFYPATAQVQHFYSYGQRKQTLTYNADGTVSTVTDGKNQITQLSNWHRGIPQNIAYHDLSSVSALVNYEGWITETTDERLRVTSYHHDPMGRLDLITPPAPGAPTSILFAPNPSPAYGVIAGHWQQTVTRGDYRQITTFDALWRPLLVHEFQAGNTLNRYRVSAYDGLSREVFSAYPLSSLSTLGDATLGIHRTFDGIGRLTTTSTDSELGLLSTQIEYQPNFRKKVTNPRGKISYFDFQAFEAPSEDNPTRIEAPEGQTTVIVRDVYGKPRSISRTDPDTSVTLTRRFNYDNEQRLCKRIDPETGEQVFDYDLADNLLWSAHGLSLNDPNPDLCSRELVSVGEKITRDYYFGRNRLKKIDYPGLTADTDYTWFPDGQPETASRNSSVWTYVYNPRGLLETESLAFAGHTRTFTHAYDTLGALQSTVYPGGEQVDYAPNALGQPTQVGSYASGILYNEDGSLAQADFANGIQHTRPPNGRFLPERLRYALGEQKLVDLRYTYDPNGNVSMITDERSVAPADSQTFGYDDLDRLTSATTTTPPPGNYGSAVYAFDVFDNLRRYQLGARDRRYQYEDGTGRLTRLTQADNTTSIEEYGYDSRGNLHSTLPTGGTTTTTEFDRADTLTSIVGQTSYRYDAHGHRIEVVAGGQTRYPVYTRDGLLRAEYGSSDRDTYYYVGNQLIARQRTNLGGDTLFRDGFENPTPAVTTWYLSDHLGSNIATTSITGAILERSQFAPFGERWGTPTEPGPGYTGHFEDSASLTYMKARYYGGIVGRFISPDPVGVGPSGEHFNRYSYANNNPVKYVDPDGRFAIVLPFIPPILEGIAWASYAVIAAWTGNEAINAYNEAQEAPVPQSEVEGETKKKPPNPDGQNGKQDHKDKVRELVSQAESELQDGEEVLENKKIRGEDSNRRPDVQIVDKEGNTRKVFEAERKPNSRRNVEREAEYDRLGIEHETHSLDKL